MREKILKELLDKHDVEPKDGDYEYIKRLAEDLLDTRPKQMIYTFSKNNAAFTIQEIVEIKDDINNINQKYIVFDIETSKDETRVTVVNYKNWLKNE